MQRYVVVLWGAAMPLVGAALYLTAAPAFAAPSVDMLVPTANYSPSCGAGVCKTDNAGVSWFMDSSGEFELEAPDRTAVSNAVGRFDGTNLNYSYDSAPSFSGDAETDVIYQEGAFGQPDSVIGVTWCDDPAGSVCDQHYIRMRGDGVITEKVAAHETGHAVGLTHGSEASPAQAGCAVVMGIMKNNNQCLSNAFLGDTVKANINFVY